MMNKGAIISFIIIEKILAIIIIVIIIRKINDVSKSTIIIMDFPMNLYLLSRVFISRD